MQRRINICLLLVAVLLPATSFAQLSSNPDKFLGNITTSEQVDWGNEKFYQLWNQITPENETKWDAIEGSGRGVFTFTRADRSANYAKQHNFPFKYHTFIWGGQYPGWMNNLSTREQYNAIIEYYDGVKAHYPNLEIVDVVNEAIMGHNPAPYRPALGGEGRTGYDWILKAFDMAHERWPDAILVYNDYNTFTHQKSEFIDLVRTLRDAGAPIDAYGCQSHDITDISLNNFQNAMSEIQDALKMPMYSTEFDIGTYSDQQQLTQYKNLIPVLWEADYCAGITLWGYIYGHTWTTDGNSGIIKEDGTDRPAMEWLRTYMQSDAAKTAKSPFPNFKKEASIYIRPAALKVAKDDVLPIKVNARLATKTIEKVDFYVDDELIKTMTEAPYIVEYTASNTTGGWKVTKAVVTATDGTTYERYGRFNVSRGAKHTPYNETIPQIPGSINVTEYDNGISGVVHNNASRSLALTKDGQWMEYTVDVQEDGYYVLNAEVASTKAGGMFHLSEYSLDDLTFFTDFTEVPNTNGADQYQTLRCPMKEYLTAGRHVLCLNIDKGGFYIKSLSFTPVPVIEMPGTLEIEDFYACSDGVDIVSGNGGSVLSNTANGEWLEYLIDVNQEGKYSFGATVSSPVSNSKFTIVLIDNDGSEKTLANITVPQTGGLDTYQVKTGKIRVTIKEGRQKLRINITNGNCNIDKIELTCTEPTSIHTVNVDAPDGPAYNLMGVPVDADNLRPGIYIKNGRKVVIK